MKLDKANLQNIAKQYSSTQQIAEQIDQMILDHALNGRLCITLYIFDPKEYDKPVNQAASIVKPDNLTFHDIKTYIEDTYRAKLFKEGIKSSLKLTNNGHVLTLSIDWA